jgi:predicted restriction endonuclease
MVDLLPKCVKCGSNVADSVEQEVEKAAHLKLGHYVNSVWI